jgi:NADPH:quinone reductase-like Zn-dependent oxidoreductase
MAEMFAEASVALLAMLDAGTFRTTATRVVEFEEVPKVLTEMAARRTIGRPVVRIA